jgi:hypothetical protein
VAYRSERLIASVSIAALIVLWIRRRSMLDLWLLVVMFLYLIEVPLSYYPAPTRFSGGWYAVRIFGFLSSSIVLMVLLHEDRDARTPGCCAPSSRSVASARPGS